MFSCLQINCQPFYLRQLLKFHQFDWLIEIYLQTEGQGTHHKMVSLQPMSGFSPLFIISYIRAWEHIMLKEDAGSSVCVRTLVDLFWQGRGGETKHCENEVGTLGRDKEI